MSILSPDYDLFIEQILYKSGHEITFVDMLNQKKSAGNSWMFEISKNTGWDGSGEVSETENVRKIWDGLILVNEITPPKYLKYEYDYLK